VGLLADRRFDHLGRYARSLPAPEGLGGPVAIAARHAVGCW
jgi:hypothetical protein